MDFLTKKYRDFRSIFGQKEELKKPRREVTKIEAYLELVYKILSWENASLTLSTFIVLNFVFWLVIQLQIRFLGVIFVLSLAAFIGDSYVETNQIVNPERSNLEALDELKSDLVDVFLSLKALRSESPSSFFLCTIFFFMMMSLLAKSMSGYVISYLTLLGVFFIPLILSILPAEHVDKVKRFIRAMGSEKDVLAEDELIPFISDKDLNERDPDLDSLLTDKTADSFTNSLIGGPITMPSHLDVDEDSLEEEDLLPQGTMKSAVSFTPADLSSDSDSENKEFRFKSGHFNENSSSEEENHAQSINFAHIIDAIDSSVKSFANTQGKLVSEMIGKVVTNQALPQQRKDSSSDSDFEIINPDEAAGAEER